MSTSFSYVCLTHDPVLTSEADVHGHGSVENSDTVAKMRSLWRFKTGRASAWTGPDWPDLERWLVTHRRCRVGVVDGYGGMVELENPKPHQAEPKDERADAILSALDNSRQTPVANITLAAEIKPGHRYLLRADRAVTPEQADKINDALAVRFPGSTFAVAYGMEEIRVVDPFGDLRGAVERARGKAKEGRDRWSDPEDRDVRAAYHGAAVALELLGRELGPQERDGAGALPVQPPEPVAATQPPAPSHVSVPLELLDSLIDGDPCELDHNQDCQAHGYFGLEGATCPQKDLCLLVNKAKAAAPSRITAICGAPYIFGDHPGIVCRKDQGHPDEEPHHDWTHDWEVWWK